MNLPMLKVADQSIVVFGDENAGSKSMGQHLKGSLVDKR